MDYLSNDKLNSINYPLIKPGLQISHEGIVVKLLEKLMRDSFGNISEKTIRFLTQNSQKTIEKARMTIKTE